MNWNLIKDFFRYVIPVQMAEYYRQQALTLCLEFRYRRIWKEDGLTFKEYFTIKPYSKAARIYCLEKRSMCRDGSDGIINMQTSEEEFLAIYTPAWLQLIGLDDDRAWTFLPEHFQMIHEGRRYDALRSKGELTEYIIDHEKI